MRRRCAGAALAALCAVVLGTGTGSAAASSDGGTTPVARKGSELARKGGISRGALKRRLRNALHSAGGHSGAYVIDVDAPRDPRLFASNGKDRLAPASNQKLFTTAATLNRFGGKGHLATAVQHKGEIGPGGKVLDGDLILAGAGDPALATSNFAHAHNLPLTPISELVHEVKGSGLRRIKGDVRVDDTVFDRKRGVGATGGHATVDLSPLSGLSFNSGHQLDGSGYADNPELVAGRALKSGLERNGVVVTGGVGHVDASGSILAQSPLARVRSPAMASLAAATNKPSNNFFAEMLLKRLAAEDDKQGTTAIGARKAERFAREIASGDRAVDGSGLSRNNRATPRQVARLLAAMLKNRAASPFRSSLPLAGREGTVADRMRGTAAEGKCRTKTGTLSNASALSGYCHAGHGTIAFSILNNSVNVDSARHAQDAMAAAIARYHP
jgi:D-alanyl-D-alanine carboxypeptidase/D-alanyl-D-alanine-endopeptidase (penicillin-binding protein 4)